MPLFSSTVIEDTQILIWNITEEEQFFMEQSGLISNKIHLKKRLEYLASRYCLQQLLPHVDIGSIQTDKDGKPYIADSSVDFSISHSFPYVAVAVNAHHKVGIDIQTKQDKILRLQSKFLSEHEQLFTQDSITNITFAWCCKEAMYKKYALGGLDFKGNMPITDMDMAKGRSTAHIHFQYLDQNYVQKFVGYLLDDVVWAVTTEK